MEKVQAIWAVVNKIPKGCVLTYGKVAEQAGLPGYCRYAGYALGQLSSSTHVPWHRVINSRGAISFPPGSERYQQQRLRLTTEGITFVRNRINLQQYLWQP